MKREMNETKKIKISETKLKSIIRESIEEIMTGGYISQGIDKQWADPNSPLRQLGDEYLRMTLDFCKNNGVKMDGSTISLQLVPKLREVILIMLNTKK